MKGVKAVAMEIKSVSDDGIFNGYLSVFGEEDHYGDVVEKGAFQKTLKVDKGQGVARRPLLWQHDTWQPVGILSGKEDDNGLLVQGHINVEVQRGREAVSLLKQRAITGLSQGFVPVKWAPRGTNQAGRLLQEIDLWEGSLATFPALPSAQVLALRSTLPPWLQEDPEPKDSPAIAEAARIASETLIRLTRPLAA